MDEVAISLNNVSKCYKRYAHPVDRLKEILLPGKSRSQEFWALKDINLDIYRGETLGVVGQNGSGKSTLLQIVAGTLTPTTGSVKANGRISALLELGSGFNPEFTGRQNVFFNGQILGLSRADIEAKFAEIAAFAEIGDFLEQPVKTYSSGMIVRLAFAVVANTIPKILIVDEALAVGDAKFQARCMKRIRQLKDEGVTILFVSHDSSSVKTLCNRAVLMHKGLLVDIDRPKEIINRYVALLSSEDSKHPEPTNEQNFITKDTQNHIQHRHGNKLAVLKEVIVTDLSDRKIEKLETGLPIKFKVTLEVKEQIADLVVGISVRNLLGLVMYGTNTQLMKCELPKLNHGDLLTVVFQANCYLNKGIYTLTAALHSQEGLSYDWIDELIVFEVSNSNFCDGVIDFKSSVEIVQVVCCE